MKTSLILIGKTNNKHFQAGIDDYISRISHYMPFSLVTIPDIKNTKSLTEAQQKEKEGELLAEPVHTKSGLITSLAGTDGFFCISRDTEGVSRGTEIEVTTF